VRDPQSPLAQTPLARATWRGDGEAGLLITMHNQHRSPDPTKIWESHCNEYSDSIFLFFIFFLSSPLLYLLLTWLVLFWSGVIHTATLPFNTPLKSLRVKTKVCLSQNCNDAISLLSFRFNRLQNNNILSLHFYPQKRGESSPPIVLGVGKEWAVISTALF